MQNRSEVITAVSPASHSRRELLRGTVTAVAGLAWMEAARSTTKLEPGSANRGNPMDVVRRFCAAWSNDAATPELAAFFTDDAVYHNIPMAPVVGREAIAKNIASFIRPGAPGIESIRFDVINIAANGPVVMTERVDAFKTPTKSFSLPVMGVFEIRGGKISAWRDYFDLAMFTSRMG